MFVPFDIYAEVLMSASDSSEHGPSDWFELRFRKTLPS